MLLFYLNDDGVSYDVSGETDTTVTRVEIPDTYNGLPVTSVTGTFEDCQNLKEFVIGNNVKKTGYGTFNLPSIERIYFGSSITHIYGPLEFTTGLKDIFYNGTPEDWEKITYIAIGSDISAFNNARKHFGIFGKSVILSHGEEKLFPYTHWDCIKGKPETVNSEKTSYDNSTSGLSAMNVKDALDELNAKHFDITSLESWNELLYLVRSGRASEFISVGDQFVSEKDGEELVWDVIGIDADTPVDKDKKHSLTLQLRNCYINMPFSVPEASYFTMGTLSPGQYYLKMKDYSSDTPVYYGFTLRESLPMAGLIRISENTVYIYETRRSEYSDSYPVDAVSYDEEDMTGTFLNQENYRIHAEMGTVDYEQSDIRKWLNSGESEWWTHSNDHSLTPIDYVNVAGFCNGMDEDFLNAVNPVVKKTSLPDGSEKETEERFFLLSSEEVYASGTEAYEYYKENSSLSEPSAANDSSRIKNFDLSPVHWWLRNSASGDNGLMRVMTDGAVSSVRASQILVYGIAPACVIC